LLCACEVSSEFGIRSASGLTHLFMPQSKRSPSPRSQRPASPRSRRPASPAGSQRAPKPKAAAAKSKAGSGGPPNWPTCEYCGQKVRIYIYVPYIYRRSSAAHRVLCVRDTTRLWFESLHEHHSSRHRRSPSTRPSAATSRSCSRSKRASRPSKGSRALGRPTRTPTGSSAPTAASATASLRCLPT
jgi:hypothetical protein